jgi:hypothetical protein
MEEAPKLLKDHKVYFTQEGGLACKYIIEELKKEKVIREESSLSFYAEDKKIYVYALTVTAGGEERMNE